MAHVAKKGKERVVLLVLSVVLVVLRLSGVMCRWASVGLVPLTKWVLPVSCGGAGGLNPVGGVVFLVDFARGTSGPVVLVGLCPCYERIRRSFPTLHYGCFWPGKSRRACGVSDPMAKIGDRYLRMVSASAPAFELRSAQSRS